MKIDSQNTNISLRHVRALGAIAQHGSFAAAAAHLGIVPSALSDLVRQMEESIGAQLFDRARRPPVMTPLAREFVQNTAPVLGAMEQAVSALRASAGLEQGQLLLGASPSAIAVLLAPVLSRFMAAHPALRCVLHDDIAERLAEMVSDGRLDLAVAGRTLQSADLTQREILRDPVGLACAADDVLAQSGAVELAQIPPERLIGLDPKTGTAELLRQSGLPRAYLAPRLMAYSTVAQLCMIREGMGVGLLSRNAVGLFGDPSIRFVPIRDLDLWRRLYLITPAQRPATPAARAFISALEEGS